MGIINVQNGGLIGDIFRQKGKEMTVFFFWYGIELGVVKYTKIDRWDQFSVLLT